MGQKEEGGRAMDLIEKEMGIIEGGEDRGDEERQRENLVRNTRV